MNKPKFNAFSEQIASPDFSVSRPAARLLGHLLPDGKGKTILYINQFEGLTAAATTEYDALILDYCEPVACERFLFELRGSFSELLYLKPVFLLAAAAPQKEMIRQLVDGVIPAVQLAGISNLMEQLLQRNREILKAAHGSENEKPLLMKAIRYLASRKASLIPVPDPDSVIGYSFPILTVSCKSHQFEQVMEAVNEGVKKGFFDPDFISRLQLCPECFSDSFSLRDICPHCKTLLFASHNPFLHASQAATVSENGVPEKNTLFKQNSEAAVMKVSVDYSKPSEIQTCHICRHQTRDPEIKAFCNSCHTESEPEHLVSFDVAALKLTAAGATAALNRSGDEQQAGVMAPGVISQDSFSLFLEHEMERYRSGAFPGTIGILQLQLSAADRNRLGNRVVRLLKEVADEIKPNLAPSNFLSLSYTHHALLILLPNTQKVDAIQIITGFRQDIERLLRFNLAVTAKKVKMIVKEIQRNGFSAEAFLASLLAK
ncbi:TackOD1 domain-containing metal-binding protein [Adhaeribacter soli]|uniref:Thaumarchaeal output domain-containing protein n=1 Tax=Adhaeribacter soli TaxID=2607655 RepID=A0A5N1J3N1_9BACT|nr:hypothetical protein [Adhaeribacter soli]KAA9340705.1 hypothetical protein F0P94_04570 [Adhaeribacter soli]